MIINIKVENIAELYTLGYRRIELERSASPTTAFNQITVINLVSGTVYYSYDDASGTVSHYYRYLFSGVGGAAPISSYSNPFKALGGLTRKLARQQTMIDYQAGQLLTLVAGSSTTVAKFAEFDIDLSLYAANRGKGTWLYPSDGNVMGQTRLVASSDPSVGTFTVDPAWSAIPDTGTVFEWHKLAPPDEWNTAINRALQRYPQIDRIPITGTGAEINLTDLAPWLPNRSWIYGLWDRPSTYNYDYSWGSLGRWWAVREDLEGLYLMTAPVLTTSQTAYLEVRRVLDPIYTDDSVLPSRVNLRLLSAIIYDELLGQLIGSLTRGAGIDRTLYRERRRLHQPRLKSLWRLYSPRFRPQTPQLPEPVPVPFVWRAR